MMQRLAALTVAALTLAGCGSDSESGKQSAATTATQPAATPTETTTTETTEEAGPDTGAAIKAVRDDSNIPLYEGATYKATVTADDKVCVDLKLTKGSAEAIGGRRTSHRTVTFPDLSIGEGQDGTCADRTKTADRKIEATKTYFLKMDDLALELEDAVKAAQDGQSGAASQIAKVRGRIDKRVTDYLLDGGDTSIGGNLLLSAATTARNAAKSGDQARLADQRREISDARNKLAEEALG